MNFLKKSKEAQYIDAWERCRVDFERGPKGSPRLDVFDLYARYINPLHANYFMALGTRENGKTYGALSLALYLYAVTHTGYTAYVRRWDDEFPVADRRTLWDPLVHNGLVAVATGGEYDDVMYDAGAWYLCRDDNGTLVRDTEPIMIMFAINTAYKRKSRARGGVALIIFEEFVAASAGGYTGPGEEECVSWSNLVSTLISSHDDPLIIMCGNTLNQYCPYFKFMGLNRIRDMQDGDVHVYDYAGNPDLHVVVSMSANGGKKKASDKFFAFDSPKLKAITGEAVWTMQIYPHIDGERPRNKDIFHFWIKMEEDTLRVDVCNIGGNMFLLVREPDILDKYDEARDLIYQLAPDPRRNYRSNFSAPKTAAENKINMLIRAGKVFFDKNELGVVWDGFMASCR